MEHKRHQALEVLRKRFFVFIEQHFYATTISIWISIVTGVPTEHFLSQDTVASV
jgi:hypothetical protein